jgi:hypothetical protein
MLSKKLYASETPLGDGCETEPTTAGEGIFKSLYASDVPPGDGCETEPTTAGEGM